MQGENDWRAELARRKGVKRRSLWASLIANAIGAILAQLYFVLGDLNFSVDTSEGDWIGMYFGVGILALFLALGAYLGSRGEAKLVGWYLASEHFNETTVPPDVQRIALNQPISSTLISFAMWLGAGVFTGFVNAIGPHGFDGSLFLLMLLGIAGLSGGISVVIIYFINEQIWMPEMPIFFPQGSITEIAAFRMTVRRRMILLFTIGSIPLLLLAVVAYNQAVDISQAMNPADLLPVLLRLEIFVVGIGILATLSLALTLGRYLIQSVEDLQKRMHQVQQGNLEVHMPATSNDEFGELAEGFNAMVNGLRQEAVIRSLFSIYVTPEVAEHAIAYGATLGGQLAQVTVLFADIRGFTSMTEKMEPEALIALLNRYFDAMSDAVIEQGGLINKFGGDSLLAVFGSPLNPTHNHALHAVRAAKGMVQALVQFNADQQTRNEPQLRMGIGIASGNVVAGNVGSEERLEYTVIGDTVNLASRLESMTKELPATVLLSGPTAESIKGEVQLAPMGNVAVRGKVKPVPVYTFAEG